LKARAGRPRVDYDAKPAGIEPFIGGCRWGHSSVDVVARVCERRLWTGIREWTLAKYAAAAGSALSHERYVILTNPLQDLSNLSYHSMLVHPLIDNDGAKNKSKWYSYFMILGLPFSFFL
jgi:hypothetical protein